MDVPGDLDVARGQLELRPCRRLAVSHQANRAAPLCVSFTNVPLSWISNQPKLIARARPAAYSFRRAPIDVQERAVELLDVDAPILHGLEGVRVLHQSARGLLRINEGSVGGELHAATIRGVRGTRTSDSNP